MNRWTSDNMGNKFCSESCIRLVLPSCDCCSRKMKEWMKLPDGKLYCSKECSKKSWHVCSVCSAPMEKGYETNEGQIVCSKKCLDGVLYPGAHLISPRVGYHHHGIYIGNKKIIHYSGLGDRVNGGPVEITTLENFRDDGSYRIRHHERRFSAEETIKRAMSRLGENSYCIVTNNCEHFANWCVTGENVSKQVTNVLGGGAQCALGYFVHPAYLPFAIAVHLVKYIVDD